MEERARERRHVCFSTTPPHEPHSQSGAKDARTPDASRRRRTTETRVSVWSACGFSAALPPTFSQNAVQGFNARTSSGNSLLGPPHEPPKIWDGQRWGNDGKNIFVRPKSLGFSPFRFRVSRRESGFGEFSPRSSPHSCVVGRGRKHTPKLLRNLRAISTIAVQR